MRDNILKVQECFKIYDYFTSENTTEENLIIHQSISIKFINSILLESIFIELSKLYNSKEKFNISKFVNKFRKEYTSFSVPIDTINLWSNSINAQRNQINTITNFRNRITHNEISNNEKEVPQITKKEIRRLITTTCDIFKGIYYELKQSSFMIEEPVNQPIDDLKKLINILASKKRIELDEIATIGKAFGLDS